MNTRAPSLVPDQESASAIESDESSAIADNDDPADDIHRHLHATNIRLALHHEQLERSLNKVQTKARHLNERVEDVESFHKHTHRHERILFYSIATVVILGVTFLLTHWIL